MLNTNGFGYVCENQYVENENDFLASFTQSLKYQFCKNDQIILFRILLGLFCTSNLNLALAMSIILILLLYEH